MIDPVVITVQGEGGAVWEMDLPATGTLALERFAEQVGKGQLTVIAGEVPTDVVVDEEPPKTLDEMTVAELREFAAGESIDLGDASKKADILAAISAASGDPDDDVEDDLEP